MEATINLRTCRRRKVTHYHESQIVTHKHTPFSCHGVCWGWPSPDLKRLLFDLHQAAFWLASLVSLLLLSVVNRLSKFVTEAPKCAKLEEKRVQNTMHSFNNRHVSTHSEKVVSLTKNQGWTRKKTLAELASISKQVHCWGKATHANSFYPLEAQLWLRYWKKEFAGLLFLLKNEEMSKCKHTTVGKPLVADFSNGKKKKDW